MEKPPPTNPNYYQSDPPPPYDSIPVHQPNVGTAFITGSTGSTTYVQHEQPQPSYGAIPIIVQPSHTTDVILVGGCPACRVGVLSENFTLPGICCALLFFPIGLLCCLVMRERTCSNCGARFD